MPARKPKPVEAGDGSYAGMVLAAFDTLTAPAAAPCTCAECRSLDRAHPNEGFQLRLLSSARPEGEPATRPARPSHPDAPAVRPAGVSVHEAAQVETRARGQHHAGAPRP